MFLVEGEQLIGRVTLSNVVRGARESCTIGYFKIRADPMMQRPSFNNQVISEDELRELHGYTGELVRHKVIGHLEVHGSVSLHS